MDNNRNLLIIWAGMLCLTLVTLFSFAFFTHAYSQVIPSNNTQNTSPNNRTSVMIVLGHGVANYTLSDFLPSLASDKCPLTAHLIDNNNNTRPISAKPVTICYF
jgi:hypothetical protein